MKKKYSRKRGPVRAKKVEFDGIKFASGLEKHMYVALKKAKIVAEYEPETFTVLQGFDFGSACYERQANGKGEYKDRGYKKILPIKYTPDFVGRDFIIECKGRANESFPLRWKMFKNLISIRDPNIVLFKPQNQKECQETVEIIIEMRKNIKKDVQKTSSQL